jgi:hypothetical protein
MVVIPTQVLEPTPLQELGVLLVVIPTQALEPTPLQELGVRMVVIPTQDLEPTPLQELGVLLVVIVQIALRTDLAALAVAKIRIVIAIQILAQRIIRMLKAKYLWHTYQ